MNRRESKLRRLVADALQVQVNDVRPPEFQHLWTRAQAHAATSGRPAPAAPRFWTATATLAVVAALAIGIHGLRQPQAPNDATAALMQELASNLDWQAPSDRMVGLADRHLLADLPDIPMVDTTPEEWHL